MLFNSIEFAFFLPIVFIIYWLIGNRRLKSQNLFLLIASYFFYGWWDWRFLSLIFFSSLVDFTVGLLLKNEFNVSKRKLLLSISIAVNLGFLGFFKYFNFFAQSFADAFTLLGNNLEVTSLNIVLPVGISFYTFQTMSYTIDVYFKKLEPTKDVLSFFAFVSFFPQLVAGPIERATNLLPQFQKLRVFEYEKAADGMRQILWGLFKKIVVADNCAKIVNNVFENPADHSGSTLVIGVIFFAFQIYGDFSGYSDIAIGTARLFGFNLMRNFNFPYFSRDIAEFWRRWHISLSSWFRDYLYIPLGGSRGSKLFGARNTIIVFVVSGFWHGANWTFLFWGLFHGLLFLPLFLSGNNKKHIDTVAQGKIIPGIYDSLNILITFILVNIGWILFRAKNISEAWIYFKNIFNLSLFQLPVFESNKTAAITLFSIVVLIIVEWIQREKQHGFELNISKSGTKLRWAYYLFITWLIIWFGGQQETFIYFQF